MKKFAKGAGTKKKTKRRKTSVQDLPEFGSGFDEGGGSEQMSEGDPSESAAGMSSGGFGEPDSARRSAVAKTGMTEDLMQVEALKLENATLKEMVRSHDEGRGNSGVDLAKDLAKVTKERDDLRAELEDLKEIHQQEKEELIADHEDEVNSLKEEIRRLADGGETAAFGNTDRSEERRTMLEDMQRQLNDKELALKEAERSLQEALVNGGGGDMSAAVMPSSGGGGDVSRLQQQLRETEQRIREQEDEIQDLIQKNVDMEVDLADYKLKAMAGSDSGSRMSPVSGDFEAEKKLNDMKAAMMQKDQEIGMLRERVTGMNHELDTLHQKSRNMQKTIDEEEERKAKKKRGWWGGKKKSKKKPTNELAVDEATGGESPRSEYDGPSRMGSDSDDQSFIAISPQMGEKYKKDVKRLLELERENARLEGVVQIDEREKGTLQEKVKRLEAQVDVYKQQQLQQAPQQGLIGVPRSVGIQLDEEAGSEMDKLKVVVQLQEAALQKVNIEKQQSQALLRSFQGAHDGLEDGLSVKERSLREDVAIQRRDLATVNAKNRELEDQVRVLKARLSGFEADNAGLRSSLSTVTQRNSSAAKKANQDADTLAFMLGEAMKNNERLQKELSIMRKKYAKDVETYQGEVRTLRDGRVRRLSGEEPSAPVFIPRHRDSDFADDSYGVGGGESPPPRKEPPKREPASYPVLPEDERVVGSVPSFSDVVVTDELDSVISEGPPPRAPSKTTQVPVRKPEQPPPSEPDGGGRMGYNFMGGQGYVLACRAPDGSNQLYSPLVTEARVRPAISVDHHGGRGGPAGASFFPPTAGMFKPRTPAVTNGSTTEDGDLSSTDGAQGPFDGGVRKENGVKVSDEDRRLAREALSEWMEREERENRGGGRGGRPPSSVNYNWGGGTAQQPNKKTSSPRRTSTTSRYQYNDNEILPPPRTRPATGSNSRPPPPSSTLPPPSVAKPTPPLSQQPKDLPPPAATLPASDLSPKSPRMQPTLPAVQEPADDEDMPIGIDMGFSEFEKNLFGGGIGVGSSQRSSARKSPSARDGSGSSGVKSGGGPVGIDMGFGGGAGSSIGSGARGGGAAGIDMGFNDAGGRAGGGDTFRSGLSPKGPSQDSQQAGGGGGVGIDMGFEEFERNIFGKGSGGGSLDFGERRSAGGGDDLMNGGGGSLEDSLGEGRNLFGGGGGGERSESYKSQEDSGGMDDAHMDSLNFEDGFSVSRPTKESVEGPPPDAFDAFDML